jgi:hypothetical protein
MRTCFTHRSVSTFDRVGPFQLTGELFVYGMANRLVLLAARKWLDALTGVDLIDARAAEWAERAERGGGEGEGEGEGKEEERP